MSEKKPANMELRAIDEQDVEFLYRLYVSTRIEEMAMSGWSPEQQEEFLIMQFQLQHTQYQQNYPDADFDVILVDGIQAGRLYVHRKKKEIRIIDMALLPEYRGGGIGTRILEDLVKEADEKQLPLNLHVEMENPRAKKLYERMGFQEVETRGLHYFMERPPGGAAGS